MQTRHREYDFSEESRCRREAELTEMRDSVMASAHAQYARAENLVLVLEFVKRSLLARCRGSSAERAQRGFVKVGPWANTTQYGWGKFFFFFPMQFYLQLQHLHYLQY